MGQRMLKSCTICQKPAVEPFRFFCSARCANVDLGRWLSESYRVPTEEMPQADGGMATQDDEG